MHLANNRGLLKKKEQKPQATMAETYNSAAKSQMSNFSLKDKIDMKIMENKMKKK